MSETIQLSEIITEGRIRADLGDIDALCNSIREFGLIQPLVVVRKRETGEEFDSGEASFKNPFSVQLVAGGRRLTALKRLNLQQLEHGRHFIWRDEILDGSAEIKLKMQGIEIEENVRRKNLTWQEEVLGKQRLLEIMQEIHGTRFAGGVSRDELRFGDTTGFSQVKLASMLGVSPATVARDLQIAAAITTIPQLKQADTKESAVRKLAIMSTMLSMHRAAKAAGTNVQGLNNKTVQVDWRLYEGEFAANSNSIQDSTVDLIYTDLPFGVGLSQMSKHDKGNIIYGDKREDVLRDLPRFIKESYRMLADNRFAVFFFGFNFYSELLNCLEINGFKVNPVPFIWFKNTRSTENPNTRYGNSYDAALIAAKGNAVFIKPGGQNYVSIPAVTGNDKLQVAQQPVELVERFLQDMTIPGSLVVDLTAGSGTTGVAAVKNKRRVIMFEREPAACQLIKARMAVLK